jgi:hypothetical protein
VRKAIDKDALAGKSRQAERVRELNAAVECRKKEKLAKIDELRQKCEAEITSRSVIATDSKGPREAKSHAEEMK